MRPKENRNIGQTDLKHNTKYYSWEAIVHFFVINKPCLELENYEGEKLLLTVTVLDAGKMKKQQHLQAFDYLNLIHLQERWIVNSNLQAIFKWI